MRRGDYCRRRRTTRPSSTTTATGRRWSRRRRPRSCWQRRARTRGVEVRGVLGEAAAVGVVVEVVETLEETAIAFDLHQVPAAWVTLIPAWFFPESRFEDWDHTIEFPTRDLAPTEICLRYLKGR